MRRHPPSSTLTYTLVPYATLFRSRYVGDILAERQLAVHGKIGERLILVELIGERRPRFIELLEVRLGPPVAQRAGRIERRAVVVETVARSEEHTSELQSLMRISYAVLCLKKKKKDNNSISNT